MSWRQGTPRHTSTIPDAGAPPPPTPTAPPAPPPPGGPPPLATWRKVVLGALLVVLVGGIVTMLAVRQSDNGDDQVKPPVASLPAPQTTAVSTPAQDEQPPPLLNTGEDWTAMVRSFEAYNYWLARHPDPELLTNFFHPLNPAFAESKNALEKFAAGEWRYDPDPRPTTVESVVFQTQLFEGTQTLLFVTNGSTDRFRIVDRAGNVVLDAPPAPPSKTILTLMRDPGEARWRVLKGQPV